MAEAAVGQIDRALQETQQWLKVQPPAGLWIGPLYQSANRYAHLYWLRRVAGVPAWFVHVLFVDDNAHRATTREEWEQALPRIERELGLEAVEIPFAGHVFLAARPRDELVA